MKPWKILFSNPQLDQKDLIVASFKTEPEAIDYILGIKYKKHCHYRIDYQA